MMDEPNSAFVTAVLDRVSAGDRSAVERLLPLVYGELRAIAGGLFARQPSDHTLQPTAVVHEAYLRLADRVDTRWKDRRHFLALAAKVMRELLADHARRRNALKRGGGRRRLTLLDELATPAEPTIDLVGFHEALERLATLHARQAEVVELRCLAGLDVGDIADVLGVSRRTVELDWRAARAWLQCELIGEADTGTDA